MTEKIVKRNVDPEATGILTFITPPPKSEYTDNDLPYDPFFEIYRDGDRSNGLLMTPTEAANLAELLKRYALHSDNSRVIVPRIPMAPKARPTR